MYGNQALGKFVITCLPMFIYTFLLNCALNHGVATVSFSRCQMIMQFCVLYSDSSHFSSDLFGKYMMVLKFANRFFLFFT